jgi:hypothetical protein
VGAGEEPRDGRDGDDEDDGSNADSLDSDSDDSDALGIRASALQLERSLGELLRTFFFDAAIPGLRPERWALLVAAMLERGVAARAAAAARKRSAANAKEKNASGTKHDAAVVPPIVEDVAAARRDGGPLWALVAAAGATKEEYEAYGDLIAGECAKSW